MAAPGREAGRRGLAKTLGSDTDGRADGPVISQISGSFDAVVGLQVARETKGR